MINDMKKLFFLAITLVCAVAMSAQLPNVKLQDINGNTVQTGSINNNGKPVIISFWATWCKPCLRELKAIHEVYPDWQDETGVKMIIVSIDQAQDANKVKPLVDGFGWEYEVLLDPNGDFKRAMNVQNVPHVFVLDGKGKIVYNHAGYVDGGEEDIYEALL
jgi:peroxiredoxin